MVRVNKNDYLENRNMKTKGRSSIRLFLATAAAVQFLMVGSAFAGDGTWDGGGSQTPGNAIWGGVNN